MRPHKPTPEEQKQQYHDDLTLGMATSAFGGSAAGALASAYFKHRMGKLDPMDPKDYSKVVRRVAETDIPVEQGYMNNAFFNPRSRSIELGPGGFGSSTVLAHEAGHARINDQPGLTGFLQRNLYPFSPLTMGVAPAVGLGLGAKLKNPWRGAGAGALSGALLNAGLLVPEAMASYHALNRTSNGKGGHDWGVQPGPLASAFLTYLAAGIAPSAIAGAVGG